MLDSDHKQTLEFRANLVISNLHNCNSGADIHLVVNMRQTALWIIECLDNPGHSKNCDKVEEILKRLETRQIDYFKNKYSSLK